MRILVLAKAGRDLSWTLLIILILTAGLTSWILIPSISNSLENGLETYASNVSTFIVIQGGAGLTPNRNDPLLQHSVSNISALPGVEAAYPITANYTWRFTTKFLCLQGQPCGNTTIIEGLNSAVIGGKNGFPAGFVELVQGHLPQGDEPAFVFNAQQLIGAVDLNGTNQFKLGDSDWNSTRGIKFNATVAGVTAINPLISEVQVLWNSTFLQHELGPALYNYTFGGYPNRVIVKVDKIGDVQSVANSISIMLKDDPNYIVNYDQAGLLALQTLQSQSLPLYGLLQGTSLAVMVAAVLLTSYLSAARKKSEASLLLTQGWTWRRYTRFMVSYYFVMALVASLLSMALSMILIGFISYQYTVFGNIITLTTTINPLYLASAIPLSLAVSGASSLIATSRMKRMGIDSVLREH